MLRLAKSVIRLKIQLIIKKLTVSNIPNFVQMFTLLFVLCDILFGEGFLKEKTPALCLRLIMACTN